MEIREVLGSEKARSEGWGGCLPAFVKGREEAEGSE